MYTLNGGITPACAGKSVSSTSPMKCLKGSPPRVRGKGPPARCGWHKSRITPACAGKSSGKTDHPRTLWDHPRVCGEKCLARYLLPPNLGSPPRVRGKELTGQNCSNSLGITPACAGKRSNRNSTTTLIRDHPRVCGEKTHAAYADYKSVGSPPRVRGKGARSTEEAKALGITPACAGKRHRPQAAAYENWDHPRVCGEKRARVSFATNGLGSPPRVRGKAFFCAERSAGRRITPACAGKR